MTGRASLGAVILNLFAVAFVRVAVRTFERFYDTDWAAISYTALRRMSEKDSFHKENVVFCRSDVFQSFWISFAIYYVAAQVETRILDERDLDSRTIILLD